MCSRKDSSPDYLLANTHDDQKIEGLDRKSCSPNCCFNPQTLYCKLFTGDNKCEQSWCYLVGLFCLFSGIWDFIFLMYLAEGSKLGQGMSFKVSIAMLAAHTFLIHQHQQFQIQAGASTAYTKDLFLLDMADQAGQEVKHQNNSKRRG